VQSVPAPDLVSRRGLAVAGVVAALVAAAVAVALVIPASPPAHHPPVVAHYSGLIGGVPLQQARCVQWSAGSGAERDQVVAALSHSVGGGTPFGPGTTLTGDEARALFQRACANPIAQHWLLYELYIRAAGFRSYAPR
jgi:hypothetical protein